MSTSWNGGRRDSLVRSDSQSTDSTDPALPGQTPMAAAFGASVQMTEQGSVLSLIVGRGRSPVPLVQRAGGRSIITFSPNKVLAVLPLEQHVALRGHPGIAFVGPVRIDQAHYARFLSLWKERMPSGP